jgi:hypothetical protein
MLFNRAPSSWRSDWIRRAEVLRRLALTKEQINSLHDNYAQGWLQARSARNTIRHIRSSLFCRGLV